MRLQLALYMTCALSIPDSRAQDVANICNAGETVVWSCEAQKAIYSVCASADLNKTDGYIFYRARNPRLGSLVFPEHQKHPKGSFEYMTSANGGASLSFKNGTTTYEILNPLREASEIAVMNPAPNGHVTWQIIECQNSTESLNNTEIINLMKKSGLGE